MSNIKLVLTDLDGTLVLPGQHEISARNHDAVKRAQAQGIPVCAVTGRPYELAKDILTVLGFNDYCIFDGGATIQHPITAKIAWSNWLDVEMVRRLVGIVLPHCLSIDYEPRYAIMSPDQVVIEAINEPSYGIFAAIPADKIEMVMALVREVPGVVAHPNLGHFGDPNICGMQITGDTADKYHGVQALLDIFGVTKEEVAAFGDAHNDLPLFNNAGLKIAVGNAVSELKAVADHVVAPVGEDGFAEGIERFVLS